MLHYIGETDMPTFIQFIENKLLFDLIHILNLDDSKTRRIFF